MSIIASLAELFRRSAVPSIESTLGQGGSRERAIENLRNLVGPGVTVSNQVIGTALSRIQLAMQRGAAIERGETVPRQSIPVDPTIPIGTEFRYRVRVQVDVPNPVIPSQIQTIDTVIPVDYGRELTRDELRELVKPAIQSLIPQGDSPKFKILGMALTLPESSEPRIEVVSVYRSPIG